MIDSAFSIEDLYKRVEKEVETYQLNMTGKSLVLMKHYHEGQFRKGPGHEPYIIHPLTLACHVIAMGLHDDTLLSVCLLHDVVEDCDVTSQELGVTEPIQEAVNLLTFSKLPGETKKEAKRRYFLALRGNADAVMVKLLDRCHNVSQMALGFTKKRMADYIEETEEMVLPLLAYAKENFEIYRDPLRLIEYQLCSLLETIKALCYNAE